MDFLKKKMKELLDDDEKKPKGNPLLGDKVKNSQGVPGGASTGERGASESFYNQAPPIGGPPPQQYPSQGQGYAPQDQGYPPQGYPPQQPYGQGPPAPHGYAQQQQQPYGQAPPPVGPPAPYGAPPPVPPGWVQQWDQNSERWYYLEQATGCTQWDPPSHLPPGPYAPPPAGAPYHAPAGHDERGLFGNTQGHQGHDYITSGAATNEEENKKGKEKSKGHSTAMLAAVGIGGVAAGAWVGHKLTEDDNKSSYHGYAAAPAAYCGARRGYGRSAYPKPMPTHNADGSSISSSDRESLEEEREGMIEAQREHEEELEEAYDSD